MTITVKSDAADLVVPRSVRRQAGIKTGDRLEFRVSSRRITIVAKPGDAADEYTPRQRRLIDRGIAQGLADVEAGRTYGPFDTVEEMAASIDANIRKLRRRAKKRKPAG